jgi:DNA-binding NtrC family response regulator
MKRGTVLLAEDDIGVRQALRREFVEYGFEVEEAQNIDEALDVMVSKSVDAVILDMKMPDETAGLRLLRAAFHFDVARANVPIIVFTGYESYENCVAAVKAGAADYMPKGFVGTNTLRELVRRCEAILEQQEEQEGADEQWFERNLPDLLRRFAGRRIAVLSPKVARRGTVPEAEEIDGYMVLSASSFEELRNVLMKQPAIRDSLPFVALLPESEHG